jgi:hypothetical protein
MARRTDELREHIEILTALERDYRAYVTTQMAMDEGRAGPLMPDELPRLRAEFVRRVSRAGRACDASGVLCTVVGP